MKHKYKLLLGLIVLPLFSSLFLVNCKKPREGAKLTFNADVISDVVALQFYDPANPTATVKVTMSISGTNAADIYEVSGKKDFTVAGGTITVGIGPSVVPTTANPVMFNVDASAPGYLPVRIPVTILPGQSSQAIKIAMVNIATPPSGVAAVQQTAVITGDSITTPVAISTPTSGSSKQSASISLPTGTIFKDASGHQLSGGSLNVTMLQYSATDPASISSFPGGGLVSNNIQKGTTTSAGIFSTAGFMNLNMDVAGQAVKMFNKPIDVAMTIDPTQINKVTNAPYKATDVLTVYSYQVETGIWKYEQDVTLVAGTGGTLVANFSTPHLTAFTVGTVNNTCSGIANLTFSITNLTDTSGENFYMEIYYAGQTTGPIASGNVILKNGSNYPIMNAPSDPVDIYVYKNSQKTVALNVALKAVGLCGGLTVNVNMPTNLQPITFNLYGVCSDINKVVRPDGVAVYYRPSGVGSYDMLGTIKNGTFSTTDLLYHSTYDFMVNYGNKVYLKTKLIDSMSYNGGLDLSAHNLDILCQ